MMHKTWNVRDQTKEELQGLLLRKYKEMDGEYKMLKKVSTVEDAKKLVDEKGIELILDWDLIF